MEEEFDKEDLLRARKHYMLEAWGALRKQEQQKNNQLVSSLLEMAKVAILNLNIHTERDNGDCECHGCRLAIEFIGGILGKSVSSFQEVLNYWDPKYAPPEFPLLCEHVQPGTVKQ